MHNLSLLYTHTHHHNQRQTFIGEVKHFFSNQISIMQTDPSGDGTDQGEASMTEQSYLMQVLSLVVSAMGLGAEQTLSRLKLRKALWFWT